MDYEMRMGTWYVRTLLRSGALKELREIVTSHDDDFLILRGRKYEADLYYSCQQNRHELGCGFAVGSRFQEFISGWNPATTLLLKRHASNVLDVRTFRGANVDSDHFLLMAKIRSRISTPKIKRDRVNSANTMRDALKQQDLFKKFSEEISRKLRSINTDMNYAQMWFWIQRKRFSMWTHQEEDLFGLMKSA